jgi:arsenical pump membrane protein
VGGGAAETVSLALLAITLAVAIIRPLGVSEAVVAIPAAVLVVGAGIVPAHDALDRLREIGPTVGFLAAILVLGHLCAEAGVFDYLGALAARASGGRTRRLLVVVVGLAAAVTVVLTLDATVVLLTPVVLATVARLRVPGRPPVYACARLANSGSLLLPVSNLTNLLAFGASGLSFGRFAALMAFPWLVVCCAEWLCLRVSFASDLPAAVARRQPSAGRPPAFGLGVLVVTVVGFVATSSAGTSPAWAALGGCVLLIAARVRRHDLKPLRLVAEASPGFCLFVLALAVIVEAVTRHGLGRELQRLVPSSTNLGALLVTTAVAAVLANLVNNLPATLALAPVVAGHPALVLAVLIGVNVGPNATYAGSLATLLWRRLLPAELKPRARQFHLLGLASVPALLVVGTLALWASVAVIGG